MEALKNDVAVKDSNLIFNNRRCYFHEYIIGRDILLPQYTSTFGRLMGFEPITSEPQSLMLPLHYSRHKILVPPPGLEPGLNASKAFVLSSYTTEAFVLLIRFELTCIQLPFQLVRSQRRYRSISFKTFFLLEPAIRFELMWKLLISPTYQVGALDHYAKQAILI